MAAIQITTDNTVFGGLGGASVGTECISWGKESPAGDNVMVFADFTIALPLLCQGLLEHYGPAHVRPARAAIVLASAFATRGMCADVLRVVLTEHTLVTREVVLRELSRALRTRIKLPARAVGDIDEFLREYEVFPRPRAPSALRIRDADDRWLLASAVGARADLLVTGDRDLLPAAPVAPVKIVDPRAFWELMRQP